MLIFPKGLQKVIEQFSSLPGIGEKTAIRLAFSLLKRTSHSHEEFAESIRTLLEKVVPCSQCFHLCNAGEETCEICKNPKRNADFLCIVETSLDILAMERSGVFSGKFFVLGGILSPMEGIGMNEIRVKEVLEYVQKHTPKEIIFALPATLEGEATTTLIWKKLEELLPHCTFSRLARGIPLGSEVQYADENTLSKAFEGRQKF